MGGRFSRSRQEPWSSNGSEELSNLVSIIAVGSIRSTLRCRWLRSEAFPPHQPLPPAIRRKVSVGAGTGGFRSSVCRALVHMRRRPSADDRTPHILASSLLEASPERRRREQLERGGGEGVCKGWDGPADVRPKGRRPAGPVATTAASATPWC